MFDFFRLTTGLTFVFAAELLFVSGAVSEPCVTPSDSSFDAIQICDLGVLSGGSSSFSKAVSEDGRVVVGVSDSSEGERAFRWTEEQGMVDLGVLPGGDESMAMDVSADGKVVVGHSDSADGRRAFVWTEESGMVSLGVGDGYESSGAHAISADGRIIAGAVRGAKARIGFRWSADSGMVSIGTEELHPDSAALGISDDGSVIVGRLGSRAFQWTEGSGVERLGEINGKPLLTAHDASSDGAVIVGEAVKFTRSKAFVWRQTGQGHELMPSVDVRSAVLMAVNPDATQFVGAIGVQDTRIAFIVSNSGSSGLLGRLPKEGGYISSKAQDLSADGSVVVGSSSGPDGNRAVLWRLER
ncbi:MAG: hypothetical protein GJ676_17280 [Rhodobacteraceae bacterium]|nr:hypothetical protein [Paracoccaceae bacterium]